MAAKKKSKSSRAKADPRGKIPEKPRSVASNYEDIPDASSDEFAYLVAYLAWYEGLTANAIVKRLKWPPEPRLLMQVKRALRRAHGQFLQLRPPDRDDLQAKLNRRFNRGEEEPITFHVVDDTHARGGGPVFAKAAEIVSSVVEQVTQERIAARDRAAKSNTPDSTEQPVICNAGGRTVYGMVNAMRRRPPVLPDDLEANPKHLPLFVAGNSAYLERRFDHSASFLSVTLANFFEASSLAMPPEMDEQHKSEHRQYVSQARLFICGAGTCDQENPGLMMLHLEKRGVAIPEDAVGDLSFNLLDAKGFRVELCPEAQEFMRRLNPTLDLEMLRHIARKGNRILLILEAPNPAAKLRIG